MDSRRGVSPLNALAKACGYVVEEGRGEAAREDLRRLLEELRARPELGDLDDEQAMALAVKETRAVRHERAARRRGRAAG